MHTILRLIFLAGLMVSPWVSKAQLAEIPFETYGTKMVVELTVKGKKINFMVDTGATQSVLDSALVKSMDLGIWRTQKVGGIGTVTEYEKTLFQYPSLNDSVEIPFVPFIAIPISEDADRAFDGIIGADMFKKFIVEIDQDTQVMRFYENGTSLDSIAESYTKLHIRTLFLSPFPFLKTKLVASNGKTVRGKFYLDTEAFFNLGMDRSHAERHGLIGSGEKTLEYPIRGINQESTGEMALLPGLQLGEYTFPELATYLHPGELLLSNIGPKKNGLIGNGVLQQFNTIWDYKGGALYIKPSQTFTTELPTPRSGVGLKTQDGQVVVRRVLKDSPAEQLGLKEGQIIVSIDGITTDNILEYKKILYEARSPIQVVVRQGIPSTDAEGELLTVTLPMQPLL